MPQDRLPAKHIFPIFSHIAHQRMQDKKITYYSFMFHSKKMGDQQIFKLVQSESLKWCHKLLRNSKMERHNIYSHKMAINTHYIQERTIVSYSQSKQKSKKTSTEWITEVMSQAAKEPQQDGTSQH